MESIEISDLGVNLEEISKFNPEIRNSELIEKDLDIDSIWQGFNMKNKQVFSIYESLFDSPLSSVFSSSSPHDLNLLLSHTS